MADTEAETPTSLAAKEPPANPKAKMLAHAATMAAATAAAVASVIRHSTKPATPEPSAMDAFFVGPAGSASASDGAGEAVTKGRAGHDDDDDETEDEDEESMKAMSGPMPVIPGHPDIADRGFAAGREDVKPDKPGSTRAQRRKPALQPVVTVPMAAIPEVDRAAHKQMIAGVSKAPNLKGEASMKLTCKLCQRVYFSHQGMRYHMQHHHGLTNAERVKLETTTDEALVARMRILHAIVPKPIKEKSRPSASSGGSATGDGGGTPKPARRTRGGPDRPSAASDGKGASASYGAGAASRPSGGGRWPRVSVVGDSDSNQSATASSSRSTAVSDSRPARSRSSAGSSAGLSSRGFRGGSDSDHHPLRARPKPKPTVIGDVTRLSSASRDRKRPYEVMPAEGEPPRPARHREPRQAAVLTKKAVILERASSSKRRNVSSAGELRCYAEAVEMVPGISEAGSMMKVEKDTVATLLKDVAAEQMARNNSGIIQRLEQLQQNTYRVVEDIGGLLKARKHLQAQIAEIRAALPSPLVYLLDQEEEELGDGMVADGAHNIETMVLMLLNSYRPTGCAALHPVELDAVMAKVAAAIAGYGDSTEDVRDFLRKAVEAALPVE